MMMMMMMMCIRSFGLRPTVSNGAGGESEQLQEFGFLRGRIRIRTKRRSICDHEQTLATSLVRRVVPVNVRIVVFVAARSLAALDSCQLQSPLGHVQPAHLLQIITVRCSY